MTRRPEDDAALFGAPHACDGSAVRVDALFREEAPRLLRYFRRRADSQAIAPDLVQDTFLRFLSAPDGNSIRNPAGYLHRIARNLLFNRSRSLRRGDTGAALELDAGHEVPQRPEQEDMLHARDLLRRYEDALETMRPKTRQIFLLSRRDGLSYREIQQQLGISLGTVEYHMMRAIDHVDALLGDI